MQQVENDVRLLREFERFGKSKPGGMAHPVFFLESRHSPAITFAGNKVPNFKVLLRKIGRRFGKFERLGFRTCLENCLKSLQDKAAVRVTAESLIFSILQHFQAKARDRPGRKGRSD